MHTNQNRIEQNIQQATTEDLMDRLTAYRAGMEAEVLDLIEQELRSRGIGQAQIDQHERQLRQEAIWLQDGTTRSCQLCRRPAVGQRWGWHRLWHKIPIFPRYFALCKEHWKKA